MKRQPGMPVWAKSARFEVWTVNVHGVEFAVTKHRTRKAALRKAAELQRAHPGRQFWLSERYGL